VFLANKEFFHKVSKHQNVCIYWYVFDDPRRGRSKIRDQPRVLKNLEFQHVLGNKSFVSMVTARFLRSLTLLRKMLYFVFFNTNKELYNQKNRNVKTIEVIL